MPERMPVRVGSRGSSLARRQVEIVIEELRQQHPQQEFELRTVVTEGDRRRDVRFADFSGRGVFVRELEEALLRHEVDVAVHSLKDMPSEPTDGLAIAAVGKREDPRDVLVSRWNKPLEELPKGGRIGTSSPRRAAQLLAYRPDLVMVPLRGNVDTRLRKAAEDDLDGIVLAAAGLRRLGLEDRITECIAVDVCTPAVGQGALAVQVRADDDAIGTLVAAFDDPATHLAVRAERALLAALGGGCQVPIAAHATVSGAFLEIRGVVAAPDGSRMLRDVARGNPAEPERLGRELAARLSEMGALDLLAEEAR